VSRATDRILEKTFHEWTYGKDPIQARIAVFERVRDIPYAIVPELIDSERYIDIIKLNRGSCTPKHFLLAEMFQRLGMLVLFVVYPFRWGERSDILDNYPVRLRQMAESRPTGHHLAAKVEIDGRMVLVDATLDMPLARLGLPVNTAWDGFSDTLLPMTPIGEEMVFHPIEAHRMKPVTDKKSLAFYAELNSCLQSAR
jgi:hypothetical protein